MPSYNFLCTLFHVSLKLCIQLKHIYLKYYNSNETKPNYTLV